MGAYIFDTVNKYQVEPKSVPPINPSDPKAVYSQGVTYNRIPEADLPSAVWLGNFRIGGKSSSPVPAADIDIAFGVSEFKQNRSLVLPHLADFIREKNGLWKKIR